MRGIDGRPVQFFSYVDIERRAPKPANLGHLSADSQLVEQVFPLGAQFSRLGSELPCFLPT